MDELMMVAVIRVMGLFFPSYRTGQTDHGCSGDLRGKEEKMKALLDPFSRLSYVLMTH